MQPVITSKRPQLVRSESENLEYSSKINSHKSVSLSNLLSKAADAGQFSSRQSYTKLVGPSDTSDKTPTDTVIFIKSCCMNHDGTNEDANTTKLKRTNEKNNVVSESQLEVANATVSSQLIKEQNISHKNAHQQSKMIISNEELLSYKKSQRTKKKSRKSKQKQVCRKM